MFGKMHSLIVCAACVLLFMSQWHVCELKRQHGRGRKEKLPRKLDINENVVRMWADEFSRKITDEVRKFTAYNNISKKYEKFTSIHQWNPEVLIKKTALSIKRLLQSKVKAVMLLKKVAQAASKNHTFDEQLQFDYLNNKKLLTDVDLQIMGINLTNPDVIRPPPKPYNNITKPSGSGQPSDSNQGDVSDTNFTYEESAEKTRFMKMDVSSFIEEQENENTARKTASHLKLFKEFLGERYPDENRTINCIVPSELDMYLSEFIVCVRKPDGEEYEPSSIRGMISSFDRHLRKRNYGTSIIGGPEFSKTKDALKAKQRDLKSQGKGSKPYRASPISDENVETLYAMNLLGKNSPNSVLNTLWFQNTLHFGMRGGSTEHRTMCWGDIELKHDPEVDLDYLEYHERTTKTRTGDDIRNIRPCPPRMYATPQTPERCPVALYCFYEAKRPSDFCNTNDPFYLATVTNTKTPDVKERWFLRAPVGKCKLDNMMRTMAKQANLPGCERLTNTSVRKSLVQKLTDNHVPDSLQVYVTGHKNTQSLNNYRTLNDRHKLVISNMLSNTKSTDLVPFSVSRSVPLPHGQAPETIPSSHSQQENTVNTVSQKRSDTRIESLFAGSHMNNCQITVNITTHAPQQKRRRIMKMEGNLLGVVGTDVPIDQIKARIPYNKLGPNGYAFVVTSQGYVLFHPNLRPYYFKRLSREPGLKANFSSIDITEIEYVPNSSDLEMLRQEILKASGYANYSIKNVVVPYDGRKRVSIVDLTYHIYPIGDTGFKLVFAVPTNYGTTLVNTRVSYGANQLSYFMDNNTRFAPWRFCKNDDILLAKGDERKRLLYNLFYTESGGCESNKMAKFDVTRLRDVVDLWKSVSTYENTKSYYASNFSIQLFGNKYGIALIFLGTKSGITRFLNTELFPSSLEYINSNERTVDSMYYKRAVEGRIQDGYNYTFSMPVGEAYTGDENNVVTISVPLEVGVPQAGPTQDLFPMVLGLQMKYRQIMKKIGDIIQTCGSISDCDVTCGSHRVNCYLLDNNGYVMLSKDPVENGAFFGEANGGAMMREMLDRRLFQEINFLDYQGMCESDDSEDNDSSAPRLLNPFKTLLSVIVWTFGEIALFLSQWSLQSWFYGSYFTEATTTPATSIGNDCQSLEYDVEKMTPNQMELFYYHFKKMPHCQPYSFVTRPCHKRMTLYKADFRRLRNPRIKGTIYGCDNCNMTYVIQWIPNTNLIFVISTAGCDCSGRPGFVQPIIGEVPVPQTEEQFCSRLENQSSYRRQSYSRDKFKCLDADDDTEDDTRCGQGQIRMSILVTICCVLLTLIIHRKTSLCS
ncbi:uncharacterized protein [Argopecten irradians]|uniref:uncharacterized protein n=1 Tax=Argopecten irradians TaxID=31199 RepID=UPI003710AB9B